MDIFFLVPIEATYISQQNPNNNFGPCEELYVGQSAIPSDTFRTLLKFDIRTIPLGSIIAKATLRLFLNEEESSFAKALYINRLLSNFSQNTVTWNNAPEFKHTFFSANISDNNVNNYVYVNITELVRGWYSRTIENNGILLSTLETATSKMEYFGFEDGAVSLWPTVLIEYTRIKAQVESTDIASDADATNTTIVITDNVTADTTGATGDTVSISTTDVIGATSPTDKTDVTGTTNTKDPNKSSVVTGKPGVSGKKNKGKGSYGKKNNSNNGTYGRKNKGNGAYSKKNNGNITTEATNTSDKGSIIPFASGGPIIMTTVNGGLVGNTSLVGFGSAAIDVPLLDGAINLIGSVIEPVINFSFSVPRVGSITSIVAYFSNIADLNLVDTSVTITAQIFRSTASDNIFNPIPDAILTLGPSLTGIVAIGTVSKGISSNLSIDVNLEDRLLLVFFATASGISLINTITGYVSAGLTIA